jgi:DNA repair exonuclease SbcCD nuclease subunit
LKVLHTADIHLRAFGDERWAALETILSVAKKHKISILAISGDLFDAKIDAEELRPKIRDVFSNNGFDIVLIPGNHDCNVCKDMYFGADATVLTDLDKPFGKGNIRIWGLPFENIQTEQVIEKIQCLKARFDKEYTNILLYHGELLDAFFSRKDFGEEGEQRYMPLKLSYFKDVDVDYVLSGHFHSTFSVRTLETGGYFVYPGSPVSVTKKETGQRMVNIFEVGKKPTPYALDTHHFEEVTVAFDPFKEEHPVDTVKGILARAHPSARVILTIGGFIDSQATGMKEPDLVAALNKATKEKCEEVHFEFKEIHSILGDDLFKSFSQKLDHCELDEEKKKQLRDLAIRAMMEAKA